MKKRSFKRGLAAFLTAAMLIPGGSPGPAHAAPPESADIWASEAAETETGIEEPEEMESGEAQEEGKSEEKQSTPQEETAGKESSKQEDDSLDKDKTAESDPEESAAAESTENANSGGEDSSNMPEQEESSNSLTVEATAEGNPSKEELPKTIAKKTPDNAEKQQEKEAGDKIGFNTGSHVYYVGDAEEADDSFQSDGSYTINIPEENPFFPYEVQFTYNGQTSAKWFMTPEDSVTVGGHKFYVSAYFDDAVPAVTQLSLEVAGDTVVVYPEKKKFTDGDGTAAMSLLPLEEKKLHVDLNGYTPLDLTMMQASYFFKDEPLGDSYDVVWRPEKSDAYYGDDAWEEWVLDNTDYNILKSGDTINLSSNTYYGATSWWQMIVGEADQLNIDNIRYFVEMDVKSSHDWLTAVVYKQDADGKRTNVSVSDSRYSDYDSTDRRLTISVPSDELEQDADPYISLAFNKSVFPNASSGNLKVYSGKTMDANAEITEQILSEDMTAKDSGYLLSDSDETWITMASYDSAGKLTGCLPIKLELSRKGSSLSLGNYMYWENEQGKFAVASTRRTSGYDEDTSCYKYIYHLKEEVPVGRECYLKASYSRGGISSSSLVTAAYEGQYSSIKEAAETGKPDIKDSLFNQNTGGGYKADYSKGIYFTIFVGEDGSENQKIFRYFVQSEIPIVRNRVDFDGYMYEEVEEGQFVRVNETRSQDEESSYKKYTYHFNAGTPIDKEYYLKASFKEGNVSASSSVTAAYEGQYSSIKEAAETGKPDIKDSLFNQGIGGGYKADYSNGIYFTIFVGEDDSEKQEIYRYFVQAEKKSEPNRVVFDDYMFEEDEQGQFKSVNAHCLHDWIFDENFDYEKYTYYFYAKTPIDKNYYLKARYMVSDVFSPSSVTAAYADRYLSIKEAEEAGAPDIKSSLFNQDDGGGYKADYSKGIYFTIFVGEDGSESQEIYQSFIQAVQIPNRITFNGMYGENEQGQFEIVSDNWDWEDNEDSLYEKCIYYFENEIPIIGKEYYLKINYMKEGVFSPSSITAAYADQYASIKEAKEAGAPDIKDSLFNQDDGGGYKADYSKGVYFTIFVGEDDSEEQEIYRYLVQAEKEDAVLSNETKVKFTGLKDKDGNDINPCYLVNAQSDTYGDYSYITILVDKDVDLTSLAPEFKIDQEGINLFAEGIFAESGKTLQDFSKGAVHYTAGSESKKEQQNYWLQIKKPKTDGGLYINSLEAPEAETEIKDGVIHSIREMMMDGRYDYQHDILLINTGTEAIPALKAEIESEQVELDPYWTLNGTHGLLGFGSLKRDEESHGELQNFARLRIKPKDGARGDISGTLTISSEGRDLMVLTLTGTIGDPYITTTTIPDAVKYVPYSVMIQNNNKYDFNKVSYDTDWGDLPDGIELHSNGELYGVPTESGTFEFTIRMENSYPDFHQSSEQTLTLVVKENTNTNVYNETDKDYEIKQHLGTEVGAGTRDYLLSNLDDQQYISNGNYEDFIDLWLNGEALEDGVDYSKESGSTIMTIKAQTFKTKARKGLNTISAEFRDKDDNLKRTSQNFRIEDSSSGSGSSGGNGSGSSSGGGTGSSGGSGSSGGNGTGAPGGSSGSSGGGNRHTSSGNAKTSGSTTSSISYDSKKGNIHSQNGIITGSGKGYSHWQQDAAGWKLIYADGTTAAGHMAALADGRNVEQILWEKVNGSWYAFGVDGYLKSGWVFDYQLNNWYSLAIENGMQTGWYTDSQDKHTYYLNPQSGDMAKGWKVIDNKWYYFNPVSTAPAWKFDEAAGKWYYDIRTNVKPLGAMYKDEATPDGYRVNADGSWDGRQK